MKTVSVKQDSQKSMVFDGVGVMEEETDGETLILGEMDVEPLVDGVIDGLNEMEGDTDPD